MFKKYQIFSTDSSAVKDPDSTCKVLYNPAAFVFGSSNKTGSRYGQKFMVTLQFAPKLFN